MGLWYFIADTHLGLDYKNPEAREKAFAGFLKNLPPQTSQVFLLGDIFDFWYEYKNVIPRRFTRTLGALADLADRGVKISFMNGNHDIWTYSYLQKEIGVEIQTQPWEVEIEGTRFCLGHGDGLWDKSRSYRFLQSIFKCRFLQILFSAIHPRWAFLLGHSWSRHNRLTRYKGEDDESQKKYREKVIEDSVRWASEYQSKLQEGKKVDHFIFGHYHLSFTQEVPGGGDISILGDWIHNPDYLVFDGKTLRREQFSYSLNIE
ncbi:MAG: UDP-2,3-diacylglucosamine diphosphatase [Bacteroidales bacterium]|nr:UDP-2,3-diacylglucosamine diphosphatase [Bacteroidales bacterium]